MTGISTEARTNNRRETKLPNLTIGLFGRKNSVSARPTLPHDHGRLLAELPA